MRRARSIVRESIDRRLLILLDATLAALHYVLIFLLIVFLAAEAILCKPEFINAAVVRRLGIYDFLYFGFAMAALATGLARVFFGVKRAAFYANSYFFWAKIATFVLIGLMSIPPTLAFARWRKRFKQNAHALPTPEEVTRVRKWVLREAHMLVLLPIFAALMARGYGVG
jgi:putative membrane protein